MTRIGIAFIIAFIHILPSFSQKENSMWYFGHNAGMNFMNLTTVNNATIYNSSGVHSNQSLSGVPAFTKGPIDTWEGCFTLSDKDGNFLFASDGMTVYNGTSATNIMENGTGLFGNPSGAQSGVIVPYPKKDGVYFVFTADASDGSGAFHGINYSIVDLNVTNSKGRGVVTNKNTPLDFGGQYNRTLAYEGLAAYAHSNGEDYWLINRTQNHFFVWKITKEGITASPITKYIVGADPGVIRKPGTAGTGSKGLGFIKFSQDGTLLANTAWGDSGTSYGSWITVASFDNTTGLISNITTRFLQQTNSTSGFRAGVFYGIEFSPQSKYLYFTTFNKTNQTSDIWRIPKENYSTSLNWTPLWDDNRHRLVNVGLGPDNKLYGICGQHGQSNWLYLMVFLNPDDEDLEYAYIPNYFPATNYPIWAFPNFVYSLFTAQDVVMTPPSGCIGEELTFAIQLNPGTGAQAITQLVWDFGDGSPIRTDSDMNQLVHSQKHTYTQTGTYSFTLKPYKSDGTVVTDKIQTFEVHVGRCSIPVNHNRANMRN